MQKPPLDILPLWHSQVIKACSASEKVCSAADYLTRLAFTSTRSADWQVDNHLQLVVMQGGWVAITVSWLSNPSKVKSVTNDWSACRNLLTRTEEVQLLVELDFFITGGALFLSLYHFDSSACLCSQADWKSGTNCLCIFYSPIWQKDALPYCGSVRTQAELMGTCNLGTCSLMAGDENLQAWRACQ